MKTKGLVRHLTCEEVVTSLLDESKNQTLQSFGIQIETQWKNSSPVEFFP